MIEDAIKIIRNLMVVQTDSESDLEEERLAKIPLSTLAAIITSSQAHFGERASS